MAKVPNIRFKGFTDEWKEAPLCEYLMVSTERNENDQYTAHDILSVSGEYGVVNQIEFQGRSFAGASLLNYRVIHHGEIAYTKSPLKQSPYGIIKANKSVTGIVSALYGVYKKKKGDPNFIQDYFDLLSRLNNYLRPLVNKGAKNTLLITDEDAISGKVVFPKENEQKKISAFISHLSATISQREKELEKLKNIKRALLERMFPQDEQTTPSIRFNGFTDEWEEKKADDIFISFDERNHPELPVLAATQDKGMVIRDEIGYKIAHNTSNEVGYKHVLPGQFVIHLRSFQGGFAHSNVEGITSPAYDVFGLRNPEKHDDCFWKYIFCSSWFIKRLVTVTYGIRDGRNVSYNEFLGLSFMVPSKQEQIRISKLFKTLGEQISLRERQLKLLKHTKQALLEQMFVNE